MQAVANAIYTLLAADSTLAGYAPGGIFEGAAPPNTPVPFVVVTKASGGREWTFTRVLSRDYQYDVKGVSNDGDGSSATFTDRMSTGDLIAERIETLMNDAALSVSGYNVLVCRADTEIDYQEQQVGRTLRHRGATFHIEISA